MTRLQPRETSTPVPDIGGTENGPVPEPSPPPPADVVPPELERELPPHTEVRLVYWLRRDYWTRIITPVVGPIEEREAQ